MRCGNWRAASSEGAVHERPPPPNSDTMPLEEAILSNMWEIAARVEVL